MTRGRRVGVLGGSFDPPHVGHRIVALDVLDALSLDRLLVIPAARPPHRGTWLSADARLDFARRAFDDMDGVEVSDIEYRREGRSYTVDTLAALREGCPLDSWVLIIGADQYAQFETWRDPERILELATLAVMRRPGTTVVPDDRFPFDLVDVTSVDVSGTQIRSRLAAGLSVRYLVPDSILEDVEMEAKQINGHIEVC